MSSHDYLVVSASLNVVLLVALAVVASRRSQGLSVTYFPEIKENKGFFSDKYNVSYKCQLTINGLPIGVPILLREDSYSEVNHENIHKVLNDYAKPLLEHGKNIGVVKLLQ